MLPNARAVAGLAVPDESLMNDVSNMFLKLCFFRCSPHMSSPQCTIATVA